MKSILLTLSLLAPSLLSANTLFIGDSHSVGIFGKKFDSLIRQDETSVVTHTSCGAVAKWFRTGQKTRCGYFHRDQNGVVKSGKEGKTPIIDRTLEEFKPELVIIELGGNYTNRSDEYTVKDIDEIVTLVTNAGAKCLWIGAPSSRKNERTPRLYRLAKEGVKERCPIFDSSAVTTYPSNPRLDGVHYWGKEGKKQAENWAQKAYEFYKTNK